MGSRVGTGCYSFVTMRVFFFTRVAVGAIGGYHGFSVIFAEREESVPRDREHEEANELGHGT